MSKSTFSNARITGIVSCIPENFISIEDEVENLYNGNIKQVQAIKKNIGLEKRHIVNDQTTTADLCEVAANELLINMDVPKDCIDAIFLVTQTPDYFQPATATYLHGKLGLKKNCLAFDINQGCAGYIYGLWMAFMMIETSSCKNVLLLAGDTISKVVSKKDPNVTPMFGDAGTATLIQKTEEDKSYFIFNTDGKKFDTIIQPKGAFRNPSSKIIQNKKVFNLDGKRNLENLFMDGTEVFIFAINEEPKAIKEILELSNTDKIDIDYIVFHQANKYIISNIARKLDFPLEKTPMNTTGKYGNQSSASIPVTISDSLRKEVSQKKLNLILSGFGVGLSWGTCQLSLNRIYCSDIIFYKTNIN